MSEARTMRSGAEPILLAPTGLGGSIRRVKALVRRYIYLLRSSGVRLVELDHAVEMNLWTDASATFVTPGGAEKEPKKDGKKDKK